MQGYTCRILIYSAVSVIRRCVSNTNPQRGHGAANETRPTVCAANGRASRTVFAGLCLAATGRLDQQRPGRARRSRAAATVLFTFPFLLFHPFPPLAERLGCHLSGRPADPTDLLPDHLLPSPHLPPPPPRAVSGRLLQTATPPREPDRQPPSVPRRQGPRHPAAPAAPATRGTPFFQEGVRCQPGGRCGTMTHFGPRPPPCSARPPPRRRATLARPG